MTAIPPEPEGARRGAADGYVPIVDLRGAREGSPNDRLDVAKHIGRVCETSGFMTIVGHGVPSSTIEAMYHASQCLFALPAEQLRALTAADDDPLLRGYHPMGGGVVSNSSDSDPRLLDDTDGSLPDLVSRYVIVRFGEPGSTGLPPDASTELRLPNRWPDIAGFRDAWLTYIDALDALSGDLMRLFALALDLPENWFDDKVDHAAYNLVANHYPPQPVPPPAGQLRQGPHTDWGSLTLLYQDDAAGGLQVMDKSGAWVDIPSLPGSFVLNIGDLMAVWTNDRWVSTMHRVVNPPPDRTRHERISVPFFEWPNWDACIECIPTCSSVDNPPRHPPTTTGDYHVRQLASIYGG